MSINICNVSSIISSEYLITISEWAWSVQESTIQYPSHSRFFFLHFAQVNMGCKKLCSTRGKKLSAENCFHAVRVSLVDNSQTKRGTQCNAVLLLSLLSCLQSWLTYRVLTSPTILSISFWPLCRVVNWTCHLPSLLFLQRIAASSTSARQHPLLFYWHLWLCSQSLLACA